MIPTRWPAVISRLTFCRARTLITGLMDRRNIWRTRNSLRVTRPCLRTRNVRLTFSSSIRAMKLLDPSLSGSSPGLEMTRPPSANPPAPVSGEAPGRRRLEVEYQTPLPAHKDPDGGSRHDHDNAERRDHR